MNPLNDHSSTGSGDPKEKKIVNEQEQNKPVNTGDQPFEEDDDAGKKENLKTNKEETTANVDDSIINKGDNEIVNKDENIKPD